MNHALVIASRRTLRHRQALHPAPIAMRGNASAAPPRWRWIVAWLLYCWSLLACAQFDAEIAAFDMQPAQPGAVVFIGSSSIRLWGTLADDFPGVPVLNRGFGGSQLPHATRYARRVLEPNAPRLVVLYSGDNDLAEGRTPQQVEGDFIAFLDLVQALPSKPRVAVISIKPSPARAALMDAQRDANARLAKVAKSRERVDFIDVFTPMLGPDGQPRPELFVEDRLHMAPAGYAVWQREIAPFLQDPR